MDWKNYREHKFSRVVPCQVLKGHFCPLTFLQGCVLDGILSEEQLKVLAERYVMDPDVDLRFSHDSLLL